MKKRRVDTQPIPTEGRRTRLQPSNLTKQKKQTKPWNQEQKKLKQDYQTNQKLENKGN